MVKPRAGHVEPRAIVARELVDVHQRGSETDYNPSERRIDVVRSEYNLSTKHIAVEVGASG
jgi:hypothetical protein